MLPAQALKRTQLSNGRLEFPASSGARLSSRSIDHIEDHPSRRGLAPMSLALERVAGPIAPPMVTLPSTVSVGTRIVSHVPNLPPQRRFPVGSIDLSRRDIGLPYGVPRRVNAVTVKLLAGGRLADQLLRKTGVGWEFVPDDTLIDLDDPTKEFKVRRLTIFS